MSDREAARAGGQPASYTGRWLIALATVLGIAVGVGLYTFRFAEGLSYLSTDPQACVNCHIMRPQYDAWLKSSHHGVAVCVDCHLPHAFLPKYIAKLENGYRHSKEFTAQTFPEPIVIRPRGQEILQANCVACHGELVHDIALGASGELKCVHCHATAGHGTRAGLGGPLRYDREQARFAPNTRESP